MEDLHERLDRIEEKIDILLETISPDAFQKYKQELESIEFMKDEQRDWEEFQGKYKDK